MKPLLSALLLLSSSLALAFTPIEPNVAWSKKSVRVCFGNELHKNYTLAIHDNSEFLPYTKEQKAWIKQIITQEYDINEVGLEFVGWQDCNEKAQNGDVVLLRTEPIAPESDGPFTEKGGRATLGERGGQSQKYNSQTEATIETYEKGDPNYLNYVILNTRMASEKRIGSENYIKLTALHEFGHTAGLRHQHVRLNLARADENCKRMKTIKLSQEPIFASTNFTGPYDNNSIMNYCYFNLLADNGLSFKVKKLSDTPMVISDETLFTSTQTRSAFGKPRQQINLHLGFSALDKHALKCMYVYDEETKKDRCHYPL